MVPSLETRVERCVRSSNDLISASMLALLNSACRLLVFHIAYPQFDFSEEKERRHKLQLVQPADKTPHL